MKPYLLTLLSLPGIFNFLCASIVETSDVLLSGQAPGLSNPILPGYYADPTVVKHEGIYYLYATLDPWGGETLGCWSSPDFANWQFHELSWPTKAACTSATSKSAMVWAPSVVKGVDGKYYMYVSVGSEVWVGGADHPLGPWQNLLGDNPLIPEDYKPGYHMIDAEAFIDDDGQAWLYWGSGWNWTNGKCWVVPLERDMKTFAGEVTDVTPDHYFEAPFMVKRDGKYYLMYSDGKTTEDTYRVHYAVGDHPRGPFAEAKNSPILVSNPDHNILGPGHHAVVSAGNEYFILYHRHSIPFDPDVIQRQTCMDRLRWNEAGWILSVPPTHEGLDAFEGHPLRRTLSAFDGKMSASSELAEDFNPSFAGDDNYATLWKPSADDASPWLCIDMGSVRSIVSQQIRFEFAWKPYAFTVQYSNDGQHWKVLEEYTETPIKGSPIVISTPIKAQFLRLEFLKEQESAPAIFEWSVY